MRIERIGVGVASVRPRGKEPTVRMAPPRRGWGPRGLPVDGDLDSLGPDSRGDAEGDPVSSRAGRERVLPRAREHLHGGFLGEVSASDWALLELTWRFFFLRSKPKGSDFSIFTEVP